MSGYMFPYYKSNNKTEVLLGVKKDFDRDGWIPNNYNQYVLIGGKCRNHNHIITEFKEETGHYINHNNVENFIIYIDKYKVLVSLYEVKTLSEYKKLSLICSIHDNELESIEWITLHNAITQINNPIDTSDNSLRDEFIDYLTKIDIKRLRKDTSMKHRNKFYPFSYTYHNLTIDSRIYLIKHQLYSGKVFESSLNIFKEICRDKSSNDWFKEILYKFSTI